VVWYVVTEVSEQSAASAAIVNIYRKMRCIKLEDYILSELIAESKLSRVSFACRMHGNYPRPRREYWTDRK
jgi:hypothetical protein